MRPPGYEPGELPTAPLRDVFFCGCKGTTFFLIVQIFVVFFFKYLFVSRKIITFAHDICDVQYRLIWED